MSFNVGAISAVTSEFICTKSSSIEFFCSDESNQCCADSPSNINNLVGLAANLVLIRVDKNSLASCSTHVAPVFLAAVVGTTGGILVDD